MWLKKGNDHYEYLELGMFLLPIHRDSVEFEDLSDGEIAQDTFMSY